MEFSETTYNRVLCTQNEIPILLRIGVFFEIQKTQRGSYPEAVTGVGRLAGSAVKTIVLSHNTPPSESVDPLVRQDVVQLVHEDETGHRAERRTSVRLQSRTLAHRAVVRLQMFQELR